MTLGVKNLQLELSCCLKVWPGNCVLDKYYEFMMCSSLHLISNETIPQSCVCLHSAKICSLNGFLLAGCLLSNGVTSIRGSIN